MATVKFLYRSTKDIAPITLRLTYTNPENHKTVMIEGKTKITITKSDWSLLATPKRIKDAKLKNLKLELDEQLNHLEKLVLTEFSKSTHIDKKWLTSLLDTYYEPTVKKAIPSTVLDYFPIYLDSMRNQVTKTTLTRYGTTYAFLKRYIEDTGENPRIDEVDPHFLMAFEDYAYDQDYAINTVNKYFSVIKSLCKHAFMYHGVPISQKFDLIKLKTFKAPVVYLNFEELKIINSIEEDKLGDRLSNVRDWLIISCFTGQRISDFMRFNIKDIREESGEKVIDIIQQKGNKSTSIPLLEPVLKIMDKYDGNFPRPISDQKFNDYVKEVAKIAGLDEVIKGGVVRLYDDGRKRKEFGEFPKYELITSHIGRRSFATNLYGKIRTPKIMNITGHSKESTFLGYIGKTSKDTAPETAKDFRKLNIEM
jgi:integrase